MLVRFKQRPPFSEMQCKPVQPDRKKRTRLEPVGQNSDDVMTILDMHFLFGLEQMVGRTVLPQTMRRRSP